LRQADQAARREAAPRPGSAGSRPRPRRRRGAAAQAPRPRKRPASAFQGAEFTAEFYESIENWDARPQVRVRGRCCCSRTTTPTRAWTRSRCREPTALYRIRVATDVRLFYRRKPNGGIEVLSLIDRENSAATRGTSGAATVVSDTEMLDHQGRDMPGGQARAKPYLRIRRGGARGPPGRTAGLAS
jgi:hypothetical protein